MTTRLRSVNASKGLPVNYCSGFRSLNVESTFEGDGLYNLARLLNCLKFMYYISSINIVTSNLVLQECHARVSTSRSMPVTMVLSPPTLQELIDR